MTGDAAQQRRRIEEIPPIPLGSTRLRVDWRFGYLVVAFLALLVFITLAIQAGEIGSGIAITVSIITLYFLLFQWKRFDNKQTVPWTKGYRGAARFVNNKAGLHRYRSDQPFVGSHRKRWRPKLHRAIGKIELKEVVLEPNPDTGRRPVLGVWRDHRYNTWTVVLGVSFSSLYSATKEERRRTIAGFRYLLDAVLQHEGVYRFSIKILTSVGEYQDPQVEIEHIRNGSKLTSENPDALELLIRRLPEMGIDSVNQRVLFTYTFHDNYLKRQAREHDGSIEAALVDELPGLHAMVMGESGDSSPIRAIKASWLTYNANIIAHLTFTDHYNGRALAEKIASVGLGKEGLQEWEAWPTSHDFEPAVIGRLGASYYETFYSVRFSRADMDDDQLWPIIRVPVPKVVTFIFKSVPFEEAQKRAKRSAATAEEVEENRARHDEVLAVATEKAQIRYRETARDVGESAEILLLATVFGEEPAGVKANVTKLKNGSMRSRIRMAPLTDDQRRGAEASLMFTGRGLP